MLNKVISNSFLYSLSSIILRASSIFLFPIFSFYLTQEDYGILLITQSLTIFITSFSGFQLQKTLTRFLYSKQFDSKLLLGNIIITSLIANSIVVVFLLFFGESCLKFFLNDISFHPYMFYSILSIFFTFIVTLYSSYLKAIQDGKKSFAFDILYYSTNIILNLVFVVVFKFNVIGLIYSTIISGIIFSFISIIKIKKYTIYIFDKEIFKSILNYSAPLIPYIWLGMGIETISTIYLNIEQGSEISGILLYSNYILFYFFYN